LWQSDSEDELPYLNDEAVANDDDADAAPVVAGYWPIEKIVQGMCVCSPGL